MKIITTTFEYEQQAVVPHSRPLRFGFVKDWTTRYAAWAINSNAVNSTCLGCRCRIV